MPWRNVFDQNLALTVLFVPNSLESGSRERVHATLFLSCPLHSFHHISSQRCCFIRARKVDVRPPGKEYSNSHCARPVHLIITMIKWIRTSRLPTKNSQSFISISELLLHQTLQISPFKFHRISAPPSAARLNISTIDPPCTGPPPWRRCRFPPPPPPSAAIQDQVMKPKLAPRRARISGSFTFVSLDWNMSTINPPCTGPPPWRRCRFPPPPLPSAAAQDFGQVMKSTFLVSQQEVEIESIQKLLARAASN